MVSRYPAAWERFQRSGTVVLRDPRTSAEARRRAMTVYEERTVWTMPFRRRRR
jgi:hypothetical protein